MSRTRGYAWTCFKTDEDTIKQLRLQIAGCRRGQYFVFGHETCPETGRSHLQGYSYYKNPMSFKQIKKELPEGCHIESAKGSPIQNRVYCIKGGNYEEFGEIPKGAGKRTDISEAIQMLDNGDDLIDIIKSGANLQTIRVCEKYLDNMKMPPANTWYENKKIYWIYGPTGTGKSRKASELIGNDEYYKSMNCGKWWDGYNPKCKWVWLDDIRADFATFNRMLVLLDKRPIRVEIKGGTRILLDQNFIITCPKSPDKFYDKSDEETKQLLRRITEVIELK